MTRPCQYCRAAYPDMAGEICEWAHRDETRVYVLAEALAKVFQDPDPSDEQVQWFLADADAIIDDFDPGPDAWPIENLPLTPDDYDSNFIMKFRCNGETYVVQDADFEPAHPVKLSTWRRWQREAGEDFRRRDSGVLRGVCEADGRSLQRGRPAFPRLAFLRHRLGKQERAAVRCRRLLENPFRRGLDPGVPGALRRAEIRRPAVRVRERVRDRGTRSAGAARFLDG